MKRSTTILASIGAGAEPGIDPRRASMEMQYRSVHKECAIEIVDYSAVSSTFLNMRNSEFVDWCSSPRSKRQPWVKVRWINITGVSWDVIKALSLKHELHPLALEDVLHTRPDNVSKADYFVHHLFLRVLIHEVADESTPTFVAEAEGMDPSAPASKQALRERQIEQAKIDALKQGTLRVNVSPMFVFLYRDGTVITITQNAPPDLLLPISDRLRRADTILRSSADPSMLVQSFLALIVDKAIELIDAYHHQISQIEGQILLNPKPSTVRKLHIVSGDLVLHKRTLEPIKTLCYGLRRYDTDRCAALVDDSDEAAVRQPIVGFMSHKSKIYLADITDNTEYILSTLDMIAGIGESLTDYSFNMASYSMNDTMRLLTMITIICLPLTFVSGYFGMNFSIETWKAEWTDVLFWIIALPCIVVISPLFIIPDLKRIWHYIQTRRLLKGFK
jgi:Mg2+ and Co2+ transporter CorA